VKTEKKIQIRTTPSVCKSGHRPEMSVFIKQVKNQDFKMLMTQFHLPIVCLAFCVNTSLIASSPISSANDTSPEALTLASTESKPAITFTNKSGQLISEAEVVSPNDGVSLVWKKDGGAIGGVVRLADLPEDLRARFGYDPAKNAAADELGRQRRAQWQQSVVAAQPATSG
jgi:hypothetical protein